MESEELVGYSALDRNEKSHEYNEDACYVADSRDSLRRFLVSAMLPAAQYELKSVTMEDMVNDFGVSSGEYALEPLAFTRFERLAQARGLSFDVEPYQDAPDELFVVKLHWRPK